MFEPTDEQIEALAKHEFETSSRNEWSTAHDLEQRDFKDWARETTASPAFQAIIRAAQAEAVRSLADPDTLQLRDGVGSPWMVAEWMNAEADRIEAADV